MATSSQAISSITRDRVVIGLGDGGWDTMGGLVIVDL
jgi:hypothetical protein